MVLSGHFPSSSDGLLLGGAVAAQALRYWAIITLGIRCGIRASSFFLTLLR